MPHRQSAKPLYQKIFERLSHEIASGRYAPGEKLPSEAALVHRFGASRITVGHAVRELQQRGLVERISGSGTYVTHPSQSSKSGLLFGLLIPNLGGRWLHHDGATLRLGSRVVLLDESQVTRPQQL